MSSNKVRLGDLIEVLTDYHANGAYKKLKENVEFEEKVLSILCAFAAS